MKLSKNEIEEESEGNCLCNRSCAQFLGLK
jgi:hypothetical protein